MTTPSEVIRNAAATLRDAGIDAPERDARRLLAHALDCSTAELMALDEIVVPVSFAGMIAARCRFQPVSQIIGYREFWGRNFRVTPDVLDPRPETETLVDLALKRRSERILDLGTGSGALAITLALECPDATVLATDISDAALGVAGENAVRLAAQVAFRQSDWWQNITGQFDLILSNPPYISEVEMADLSPDVRNWEPHLALTPGGDGLDAYRILAGSLAGFLADDGLALFEIGATQGAEVRQIFQDAGFARVQLHQDLGGQDRVVAIIG